MPVVTSKVQIMNSALLKIGAERISSESDNNKRAIACNEQWEKVRDEVLSDHPWNFAVKRVALAALAASPAWGYGYQYQLPTDCLRVVRMEDQYAKFRIEGGLLLTDESEANILYIARITDVSLYTAKFCEALALRLANDLAYHLVQNTSLQDRISLAYQALLSDAKAADAQEGTVDEFLVDDWTLARL